MALYKYFKPADGLPDPSGPLSAAVSPAAIREANEAVKGVTGGSAKAWGKCAKLTPEQQAAIGEYASLHGNQAAIRHFSEQFGVDVKASSVQTWKGKYVVEINRKRKAGDMNDLSVKSLPVKKRGRPLLLGEKLDTEIKCYIQAQQSRYPCKRGTLSPLPLQKRTPLLHLRYKGGVAIRDA